MLKIFYSKLPQTFSNRYSNSKQKQRLDTQLKYLQTNFDELEATERRLIKEKRETQREVIFFFFHSKINLIPKRKVKALYCVWQNISLCKLK